MTRGQLKARLMRAASGMTQEQAAQEIGVDRSLIANIELGEREASPEVLEGLARCGHITVDDGEDLLCLYESRSRPREWRGLGTDALFEDLADRLSSHLSQALQRLQTLPFPESFPSPEDRPRAAELLERLKGLSEEARFAVVAVADQYQNWALCEAACEESVRQAACDLESAASWARLAREIAVRVRGTDPWCRRNVGYAAAHQVNVSRVAGELRVAEADLAEAKQLWETGSDPDGLLDPGRILEIEASLRRDQRGFDEALDRLDEALVIGRSPESALISKGFTYEVMGDCERAITTLLEAIPLADRRGEPRLKNIARLNLAINLCHVGRHADAVQLVKEVRPLARVHGFSIDLIRIRWVEGRIAAGLGRPVEARGALREAREQFAERGMSYDVALALLEEAALLLDEGRTAEVKALAPKLAELFEAKGVHREALAALRLFHEAAEREEATAELARSVLRYLFQARHDQGLRFSGS